MSVKHRHTAVKPDGDDDGRVQPSWWNEDHDIGDMLNALIALAPAASTIPYIKSDLTGGLAPVSAFARSLLQLADAVATLNALGAAPLNSPGFGGTPTAPTPTDGDNSSKLATTAYLDRLRAASSGLATLDSGGHVPTSQLPAAIVGALQFQGTWNATTNTPALASNVGSKGNFYIVATAGTTTLNGLSQWNLGDWAIFDGTIWRKIDGIASEVLSVAGRTGAVTLALADITDASANGRSLVAAANYAAMKGLLAIASGDVSGLAPSATTDTTNASNISSGTLPGARLPTPASTVLGGVKALAAVASRWLTSIGTDGIPVATQPAFSDISGTVALAQLPAGIVGAMQYQGTWNASTNSPALASGVGTKGFFYKVATAGTTALDGLSQWNVGDLALFDGTVWDKIDGVPSEVLSVAGRVGAITLALADLTDATANGRSLVSAANYAAMKGLLAIASGDVSGLAASATTDTTNASNISSGTLAGARLPAPSSTVFGGIKSLAAVANKFLTSIGTDGIPVAAQPAFSDISGTIALGQLPSAIVGAMQYQGVWNASTNSPALASSTGTKGYFYKVGTAGTTTLDGLSQWNVGDLVLFDGTVWDKIDGIASEVLSVAGRTGAVTLAFTDISGSVAATQMPAHTGDVTSTAGAIALTIAANAVTNGKSAQMAAKTLKGNPTAALANASDFTISGLTARGAPDAANDKILMEDAASGTMKYVTPAQVAAAATAGVSSLGGATGAITLGLGLSISGSTLSGGREVLAANRTYYVRTDGSDSNNGLTNASGGAFLTIQKAVTVVSQLDLSSYNVTIQVADGTYTAGATVNGPWLGSGTVTLQGNTTTPANCIIAAGTAINVTNGGTLTLLGFKVSSSSGNAISAAFGGTITINGAMNYGTGSGSHLSATDGGRITIVSAYTISGGAASHWSANGAGAQIRAQSITITLTGTPAFSNYFATARFNSAVLGNGNTFSGTATGQLYYVDMNAVVTSGGVTLPGSTAGSALTGGQYN